MAFRCAWIVLLANVFVGLAQQVLTDLPKIQNATSYRKDARGGKPVLAMANSPRCLYNGKPVEDGLQISSPEPCLNCSCSKGVLLCYLHTCPTVIVPSADCYAIREDGFCCPQVRCKSPSSVSSPSLRVQRTKEPNHKYNFRQDEESHYRPSTSFNLETKEMQESYVHINGNNKPAYPFVGSNHKAGNSDTFYNRFRGTGKTPEFSPSTTQTSVTTSKRRPVPEFQVPDGEENDYESDGLPNYNHHNSSLPGSCYSKGYKYSEGMAMLSPTKCEYCYCIRGQQMCVRPKCHLNIAGCAARYQSGFTCCPSHYQCEVTNHEKTSGGNQEGTYVSIGNAIRVPSTAQNKVTSCRMDGYEFAVGVAVPSRGHCQTCYCTQVGVVCRRLECSPRVEGCKPVVPEGHCCPAEYFCESPGSNHTRVPISHSTENYDVTVFSPSDEDTSTESESGNSVPEADPATDKEYTETKESVTQKRRVTVSLPDTSNLESVSVIPEESVAILVLTTENENANDVVPVVTTDGIVPAYDKTTTFDTTSNEIFTTNLSTQTSELETTPYNPSSPKTTHTDTPTTASENDSATLTNRKTGATRFTIPEGFVKISGTGTTRSQGAAKHTDSEDGEYYYEEYYQNPKDDYDGYNYPDQQTPPPQKPEENNHLRETYSPFSDYDKPGFGDRVNNNNVAQNSTITDDAVTNPSQTDARGPPSLSVTVTRQEDSSVTTRHPSTNIREYTDYTTLSRDNDKTTETSKYTFSSEPDTLINDRTDSEMYNTDAYGNAAESLQSTLSTRRTDYPSTIEHTNRYRPFTIQTFLPVSSKTSVNPQSSQTYRPYRPDPSIKTSQRPPYTSAKTQTSQIYTTTYPQTTLVRTQNVPYQMPHKTRTSIRTQHPYVSTAIQTYSPYTSTNAPYNIITTSKTHRPPSAQQLYTYTTPTNKYSNALPQEIADLLWSITKSQTTPEDIRDETTDTWTDQGFDDSTTSTKIPQSSEETLAPIALAAPKLIIEQTTAGQEYGPEGTEFVDKTTNGPLFNYGSQQIIFSNHGPSVGKRPIPSKQNSRLPPIVNNHKTTSNRVPPRVRPSLSPTSPQTPIIEFSNHRPTNSYRRPPSNVQPQPALVHRLDISKKHPYQSEAPYKLHRVDPKRQNSGTFQNEHINSQYGTHQMRDRVVNLQDFRGTTQLDYVKTINPFDVTETESFFPNVRFGIRPSQNIPEESSNKRLYPSTRWNDVSTNPVTVAFRVNQDEYDNDRTRQTTTRWRTKKTDDIDVTPVPSTTDDAYDSSPEEPYISDASIGAEDSSLLDLSTIEKSSEANNPEAKTEIPFDVTSTKISPTPEIVKTIPSKETTTNIYTSTTSAPVIHSTSLNPVSLPKMENEIRPEVETAANETKLYRADDENDDNSESSFVDRRLIPFGSGPFQRFPESRPPPPKQENKPEPPLPPLQPPTIEEDSQEITDVCFVDGRYYNSGEIIVKSNPCEMCRCFYGHPLCQVQQCPTPPEPACILEYLPGYCCPRVTCGVKLEGLKPPIDLNGPILPPPPIALRPPPPTSDNQWKPLTNAYPHRPEVQHPNTTVVLKEKPIIHNKTVLKDPVTSVEPFENESANSKISYEEPKLDIRKKEDMAQLLNPVKDEENALSVEKEKDDPLPSLPSRVPVQELEPIYGLSTTNAPETTKKPVNKTEGAIHDNSSGVRKVLDESVVLPASKVSLSPMQSDNVNTVLPVFHTRPPPVTEAPDIEIVTLMNNGLHGDFSVELGGNLKVSGCNVYGKYYKINDKVSALSKPCTECICSADGISCNAIC